MIKSKNYGRDYNEFYRIYQPLPVPAEFSFGVERLAAKAECVKCGRFFVQILRIHETVLPSWAIGLIKKEMPSEEKIMTSFMLRACENGVGCWKVCRPHTHIKTCQMPSRRFLLNHDPHVCKCPPNPECTCETGCGNKGIYPCRCGHAFGPHGKHMDGCPVGLYRRTSAFSLDFMRSQLVAAGRRRP